MEYSGATSFDGFKRTCLFLPRPSMASIKTALSMEYSGATSFDGFKGTNFADSALFLDKEGSFIVRGTCAGIAKDLTFSKDEKTLNIEGSTEEDFRRLVNGASITFNNNDPKHPQLGKCTFETTYVVRGVEEWQKDTGVFDLELQMCSCFKISTPSSIFVDLNMHNPDAAGWKPQNVYMFGETMQAGAVLALTHQMGVNVLTGTSNKIFAEGQYNFLRSVARSPMSVTTTESSTMGPTHVKVKLDRMTSFISEAFKTDPEGTLRLLRRVFTAQARLRCGLEGDELLAAALGLDVKAWKGTKTAAIFNRLTPTSNNDHFDLTVSQIAFLGNVLKESGVDRVIIFGDDLTEPQQKAIHELEMEVVDQTRFWKCDAFAQCFGDGVDISAQCFIQLVLQDYISLCLGPHSGGTDYCGFMGSPVIFWTSSDHPAHPRMPRLTEYCSWWWCLPVGSTMEIKAAKEESGFPETGKENLRKAIKHALTRS